MGAPSRRESAGWSATLVAETPSLRAGPLGSPVRAASPEENRPTVRELPARPLPDLARGDRSRKATLLPARPPLLVARPSGGQKPELRLRKQRLPSIPSAPRRPTH